MTYKDKEAYLHIKGFIEEHGYAPSYREIGKMTGVSSTSTVCNRVRKLLRAGWLETDHPESPRALRIKGARLTLPEGEDFLEDEEQEERWSKSM